MNKALVVLFDKENDANREFFKNLRSGKYLWAMILSPSRMRGGRIKDTSKTTPRIKDTSNRAPKVDRLKIARALGADIINFDLIDGYNFKEFTLTPELGTDFREENNKIVFFKDERLATFDCSQILQIINMDTGKPVWERK